MQTEQFASQNYEQTPQQTGTTFEHGADVAFHASNLESVEAARAAVQEATRPLEEAVQNRLEYQPLLPQEIIKRIGRKVVFDLRKGYNETHINLYDDTDASAPYITNPDDLAKSDVDVAA